MDKKLKKALAVTSVVLGTAFVVMRYIAKKQYPKSVYADQPEEQNPMKYKVPCTSENKNKMSASLYC